MSSHSTIVIFHLGKMAQALRETGGEMVCLFHNLSLGVVRMPLRKALGTEVSLVLRAFGSDPSEWGALELEGLQVSGPGFEARLCQHVAEGPTTSHCPLWASV